MNTFPTSKVSDKFKISCPKDCSKDIKARLFGDMTYTADSSICRAAIHNGAISDLGGET